MSVLEFLLFLFVVGALLALAFGMRSSGGSGGSGRVGRGGAADEDAEAEARRWYDRLGGQVMSLTGTDEPSKQALADASERYTAAGSQLSSASTPGQYRLVTETAFEGLYYVRAARTAMGMDPGPDLPSDRDRSGTLTSEQQVQVEGRTVTGSPQPSATNTHYHPGGTVQGRPVAAGWYSEPWWKPALLGGAGAVGGFLLADALFSGFGGDGGADMMAGGFDGGGFDQGFDGGGFDGGGDFGGFDGGGFFDSF